MADRFPLVANSGSGQIQEIPSGDTLDLTGNNINGVGIITATTVKACLLYTSPSPRDLSTSRMPSSA